MKRFTSCLAALVLALAGVQAFPAPAAPVQARAAVSTLRSVGFDPDSQVLTLLASAPLIPRVRSAAGKLLIDLPQAVFPAGSKELAGSGAIARIRIDQQSVSPPLVRLALDLHQPLEVGVRRRQVAKGYEIRIEPVGAGTPPSNGGALPSKHLGPAQQPGQIPQQPGQLQPANRLPQSDQPQSNKPQLLDLRLSGENLVLQGSGPLAPEVRRIAAGEYMLMLYGIGSGLKGPQPRLQSPLIASVTVSQEAGGTALQLRLSRPDIELVPVSAGNFSTLQLLDPAKKPGGARLTDLRIEDLDARTTRVRLYADQRFGYQVYPLEKPDRLVIDTRGTSMGALPQRVRASRTVRGVRFAPTRGEQDLRVVLDLGADTSHRATWKPGYLELLIQRKAEPAGAVLSPPGLRQKAIQPSQQEPAQVSPPSLNPPLTGPVRPMVVIDAGHGGNDPGAIGVQQIQEKDVTLAVSRYLAQYLEHDRVGVALTRDRDLEVLLQPRVNQAHQLNAGLFVSIHCNSMAPSETPARGIETYYTTPQSKELAAFIHRRLIHELGATDRHVRYNDFFVTRKPSMPSVLIEIGFLTHPEEGQLLNNPEYQRRIARAIRGGIQEYLAQHRAP